MCIVPDEWEVDLIRRFDREALIAYAKEAEREQKKSNSKKIN